MFLQNRNSGARTDNVIDSKLFSPKENCKSFWRKKFGIDDIIGSRPRAVTRSSILSICKIYIYTNLPIHVRKIHV